MKALKKLLFVSALLVLMILSNGQYGVFFAIWLAVPMLLFTVRQLKRWQGVLLAFLLLTISYYIAFDVVPFLPTSASIMIAVAFNIIAVLPYLIDSLFSKNRDSFLSTLIFPTAVVLIEYTYHQFNLYGTWGHTAYSQQSQHILLQSVSVFGLGYITFLITWFAAIVNWMYEQRNTVGFLNKGVVAYGVVLMVTLIFGVYRIHFEKSESKTVSVASISALDSLSVAVDIPGLNNEETEEAVKHKTRENTDRLNGYLFDKSIEEAEAGAEIVFWAEGNSVILKEDETLFYEKAGQIAADQDIYLGVAVAVIDPSNPRFLENKFVMFNKAGDRVIDYWKGKSVPGAESPISNNKEVGIQKISTEYGNLAGAICFDLDFPDYLKQAKGADILLSPSNDWEAIDPIHTDMTRLRAIEQGFNFIRQTSHGLSVGTDYTGKVISEMDHFRDNDKTLRTELPTKGVSTIYSVIGDSFIVFCLLVFVSISVALKVRLRNQALVLKPSNTI